MLADIWNPKTLENCFVFFLCLFFFVFVLFCFVGSRKSQRLRASAASGHGVPDYVRVGLCEDGCTNAGVLVRTFSVGWPLGQSS